MFSIWMLLFYLLFTHISYSDNHVVEHIQISLSNILHVQSVTAAYMLMDAIDCRILERSPFDETWYSHKLNGPSLQYKKVVFAGNASFVLVAWTISCRGIP